MTSVPATVAISAVTTSPLAAVAGAPADGSVMAALAQVLAEATLLLIVALVAERLLRSRLHPAVCGVLWHVVLCCLLLPAAAVSLACLGLNLGLLRYLYRLE